LHILPTRLEPLVTLAHGTQVLLVDIRPATSRFRFNLGDDRARLVCHSGIRIGSDIRTGTVAPHVCLRRDVLRRLWLFGFLPYFTLEAVLAN
jgi:hypothetical protein